MSDGNKDILIKEVIQKLHHFTKLYGIESLFIVGGYCRELYLGQIENVNDIDVASAFHEQAIQLGGLFASEILNETPKVYHRSGAAMVEYQSEFGSIKVEFQGQSTNAYMFHDDIREWMRQQQIPDVPLMNNIYGRDFTINSLIYSLNTGNLLDPTGLASPDMEKRSINSLLPPQLLVKYNPLSVLRAIRFALTYDFHIHPDLRKVMYNKSDEIKSMLSEDRIFKEIVRILKIDGPKGLEMLKHYHLDELLLHPDIKEHLTLEYTNA